MIELIELLPDHLLYIEIFTLISSEMDELQWVIKQIMNSWRWILILKIFKKKSNSFLTDNFEFYNVISYNTCIYFTGKHWTIHFSYGNQIASSSQKIGKS